MRVCVTGSFGGGDIGDDAMVFPHLNNLDELGFKKEDVWLIGHRPTYMSKHFQHPIDRCMPSDVDQVSKRVLESTDVLLVTGGGTINTRAPDGWSLHRMHRLVTSFTRRGIPAFMSGQTIGPLGVNPLHDKVAKELLESVDVLTVRDKKYSKGYIEKIGAKPKRLVETVDDATTIEPWSGDLPVKLPEGRKAAVNVTVYTYDTPEKKAAVRMVCHRLSCAGNRVLLVPHHGWDLEALKELTSVPGTTLVDTTGWLGSMTKRLFSECDLVVAGRYHAVVFAMSAQIPCVGMAGNEYSWIKQHGFADQLGLGASIVSPSDVTDVETILGVAEDAITKGSGCVVPESESFGLLKEWMGEKQA